MTLLGVLQTARLCPEPCIGNLVRGMVTAGSVARPSKRTAARWGPHPCRLAVTLTHPGALLSDWRAAKAVRHACRAPHPAHGTHVSRPVAPGLRARPPMPAVITVILRYGRGVIPCQRRRRRRSRQACPRRRVMAGEPGGNRQPVRRGPKSRPAEATTRSGRRSCRWWSLAADMSSAPRRHCPAHRPRQYPQPGSKVRGGGPSCSRSPQLQCAHHPPASGNCLP